MGALWNVSLGTTRAQGFDGRLDELSKRPATTRDIDVECEAKDLDKPTSEEPSSVTTGGSQNEIPPEIVVNGPRLYSPVVLSCLVCVLLLEVRTIGF